MNNPIAPHGGQLAELLVNAEHAAILKEVTRDIPSLDLDRNQLCDLELLMNGGYSPLKGYLGRGDYESVLNSMSLQDGTFWPWPITLRVNAKTAESLSPGQKVALRDPEGFMPAVLTISDIWPADLALEQVKLGASLPGEICLGGTLEGLAFPPRHDFMELRLTPAEMRSLFQRKGWKKVISYQPAQPIHRVHRDFAVVTSLGREANLLIHGIAGTLPPNETGYFSRIRSYQAAMEYFPAASTTLALSPLGEMGAHPREILLRAIVACNYGCSHLIVGGDGCSESDGCKGADLVKNALAEAGGQLEKIGIELIPFERLVYVEEKAQFIPENDVPENARILSLPGTELMRRLDYDLDLPDWFTFPQVEAELRRSHPPRHQLGFTVFFTGLSGAGKSTLAKVLQIKLLEMGGRQVTLLDGDIVRRHLSSELGFSREHRDINVRRIGYVASEITKNHGIAICAPIAPYSATRADVRNMIEPLGGFFEIHVATPLSTCENRDRKGLYAKARAGLIKEFTGISDPYEIPEEAELTIDTSNVSVDEAIQRILLKLEQEGYLR